MLRCPTAWKSERGCYAVSKIEAQLSRYNLEGLSKHVSQVRILPGAPFPYKSTNSPFEGIGGHGGA